MNEHRVFQVRPLAHDDLPKLLALYAHLHLADDPLPAQDQVEAIWGRILRDDSHVYMGGFLGKTLISACNAVVVPNLTRGTRPYAVIENVVTHAEHRRTGAGTKVMRRLIDECIARSCYKIMLMSSAERANVHAFYESLGFDKRSKQAFVLNVKSAKPHAASLR
jgi:GNAT superfamily N-acetyltransferase